MIHLHSVCFLVVLSFDYLMYVYSFCNFALFTIINVNIFHLCACHFYSHHTTPNSSGHMNKLISYMYMHHVWSACTAVGRDSSSLRHYWYS